MRKKDREFWESARYNNAAFIQYYQRLIELCVVQCKWHNLPDSVDPRYLELALLTDGKALFFYDDVLGYLALRCNIGGGLNVYNLPIIRNAYAANGYYKTCNESDSVLIFNNYMRTPSLPVLENYAKRLWDMDRIIDVNVRAQKTPMLIVCPESQRLTMLNLYEKYDGNQPVIFGSSDLDIENRVKAITTGAPFISPALYQLRTQIWNEALTYCGISNVSYEKRERLISDEVTRNNGGTYASAQSRQQMRELACEQINKMFGLNVWVEYLNIERQNELIIPEKENAENEHIYDTGTVNMRVSE